jgi:two-component system, chemotaxis family, sensor kinase Cph1
VNDVLDFSKIEAGKVELDFDVFDLSALVAELDKTFGHRCVSKTLDWRVVFDFETPYYVRGDQKHLRQVLMNLIGNAVKFTETGFVSLTVNRDLEQGRAGNEACSGIKFEVADSGVGIGVEDQKAMFNLFEQGQRGKEKGGTGLGLGIAIRLADLMGGEIRVESEIGNGATFILSLPLVVETVSPIKLSGRAHDLSEGRKGGTAHKVKALVVDDVADNRLLLRMLLERMNVNVEEASNGRGGMELVSDWGPDIVFMDLRMPGMSGYDFLEQHREDPINGSLPVIAVTASAFQHEREACLERGFDDFLSKPIELDELDRVFRRFTRIDAGDLSGASSEVKSSGLQFAQLDEETSKELSLLIAQYRRTELKETLLKLKEGGGPNQALATHCLALVSSGDWKGLAEIVDQMSASR